MQLLRRRKTEDRSYSFHPALEELWAQPLGLNYKSAVSQDAALQIADIYACVRCLSDAAASVPLIAYRRTDGGRQRLHQGFLPELLQRPSPSSSQPNLVGQLLLHLNLYGNGYIAKYRDDAGRIAQLGLLHPDLVEPELVAGEPRYVVTDAKTGRQSKHDSGDLVHVKAMSSDGLKGLSPIAQCRLAVSLSKGMGEYAEAFIRNGLRPSGILRLPTGTAEQMSKAREIITEEHAGAANAHKIAIVKGDAEWTALSVAAEDAQFVEQRRLSTAEIARIFRIPPWMIGAASGDSYTYSNTESQALAFVVHSLRPWLVLIESAFSNDRDLCSQNQYVEFLLDALLRADSKTRSEVYTAALNPITGWMTRDEVRRLENLEQETVPIPIPQATNGVVA
jgi:HK97 family phage portal protein